MPEKNVKNKKVEVVFIVYITLFIMISILMNLRGHLVIKKGVVQRYRVGIIERVKKEIDITIPEDVSEIGDRAFANNDLINKIIIPSGVKKIGEFAFMNCSNLEEVDIHGSLEIIKKGAFYKCTSLDSINLPDKLEQIGHYAFFEIMLPQSHRL